MRVGGPLVPGLRRLLPHWPLLSAPPPLPPPASRLPSPGSASLSLLPDRRSDRPDMVKINKNKHGRPLGFAFSRFIKFKVCKHLSLLFLFLKTPQNETLVNFLLLSGLGNMWLHLPVFFFWGGGYCFIIKSLCCFGRTCKEL